MKNVTYSDVSGNTDVKTAVSMRSPMENKKYDTIKIKRDGIQINLEFPPKSARDQLIEQEVKAIIAGELKEKSRRYIS